MKQKSFKGRSVYMTNMFEIKQCGLWEPVQPSHISEINTSEGLLIYSEVCNVCRTWQITIPIQHVLMAPHCVVSGITLHSTEIQEFLLFGKYGYGYHALLLHCLLWSKLPWILPQIIHTLEVIVLFTLPF